MAIRWLLSVQRFAAVYGAFAPLLIVAAAPPDACSPPPGTCAEDADPKTLTCQWKASAQGTFKVRILSAIPDPPAKLRNDWIIQIFDASGAPIVGTRVVTGLYMPVHQHAQTPPAVTANANGTYSVSALQLAMPGDFELTFRLPDLGTDHVTFSFNVQ